MANRGARIGPRDRDRRRCVAAGCGARPGRQTQRRFHIGIADGPRDIRLRSRQQWRLVQLVGRDRERLDRATDQSRNGRSAVNAGYQYEHWSFSSPSAFGSDAPWGSINRPSVGFKVGYQVQPDIGLFVAPQFEWDYETGAGEGGGQNFGAVLGATKIFSRDLVVGLGAGVFHQINETKVFPFLIVNWKIDDKWKLANPLPAGPAGGAGLELVYAIDDNWDLAAGGTYREYRFRLKNSGPNANGIGQNQGIPLFARLTRKLGPNGRLDLYAGATVAGTLKLRDQDGNTLVSSDYNAAPFVALDARGRVLREGPLRAASFNAASRPR